MPVLGYNCCRRQEALDIVEQTHVDLVLLDMKMSGMVAGNADKDERMRSRNRYTDYDSL